MGLFDRILARRTPASAASDLYPQVVARARSPHWYLAGEVPDTIDGRFDMIAVLLAMVMLRLEAEPGDAARGASVALAEAFVDDMDPQLREIGLGDLIVGKHVGQMMGMLGGRLGAYREGLATGTLDVALVRNLYRERPPSDAAVAYATSHVTAFHEALAGAPLGALMAGELPR